ncbi:MAG: 50S ribosomal protein L21 [Treponema sp.]|nr:50S ribosomal protein L21 [Treponema sp.]
MYAIVEFKGNQYKAEKDAVLKVPHMDCKDGDSVTVDTVLLVSDGEKVTVGAPYVNGAKVVLQVTKPMVKDGKVLVFKYKSKKDYHRFHGHREQYTEVTVKEVQA